MKVKMRNIFTNTIAKILYNTPSAKLERKIDTYIAILNRNKLVAPAHNSIDDVVAFAKTKKIKHDLYI